MYEFIWNPEPSPNPRREKRQLGFLALAVAAIPLLSLAGQIIISLIVRLFFPSLALQPWYPLLANSVCMYAFAMPLSYLLFRCCETEPIPHKKLGVCSFLSFLSLSMALTMVGSIIGAVVNFILSFITNTPITNPVEEMITDIPTWTIVLCMVILAPILEELFFRKLVIDRLRRYGDLPAILISGLLFGIIHGNFSQFFYAAFLGILFGLIYCQTGHLRYSIALHMIINFFGSVYSTEMLKQLGDLELITDIFAINPTGIAMYMFYLLLYGVAFLTCIPAGICLFRRVRLSRSARPLTGKEWKAATLCNPAVWGLFAVLLIRFILYSL